MAARIAVNSCSQDRCRKTALETGFSRQLVKPVDPAKRVGLLAWQALAARRRRLPAALNL